MIRKPIVLNTEQEQFLRDNYLTMPAKTMSKKLGLEEGVARRRMKKLGLIVPPEIIEKFKQDSYIKKGTAPLNKGRKQVDFMTKEGIEASRATCFKSGNKPANTLYDDAITIRVDKRGKLYKFIRIAEAKWEPLQVYNWKQAGNKIPAGSIVRFKDGDTLNTQVENLELVTRAQHLQMNRLAKNDVVKKPANKAARTAGKKVREKIAKQQEKTVLQQARLEQKQQEQLRLKQEKADRRQAKQEKLQQELLKQKKLTEAKARLNAIEQHRALVRKKGKEPRFATRTIDFAQMVSIRIDHKTIIYAKQGQDPEEVKLRYLLSINKAV